MIGAAMLMVKAKKKKQVTVLVNLKNDSVLSFIHMCEWWTDKYEFINEVGERVDHPEDGGVTLRMTSPKFPSHWDGKLVDVVYAGDRIIELVPREEQT